MDTILLIMLIFLLIFLLYGFNYIVFAYYLKLSGEKKYFKKGLIYTFLFLVFIILIIILFNLLGFFLGVKFIFTLLTFVFLLVLIIPLFVLINMIKPLRPKAQIYLQTGFVLILIIFSFINAQTYEIKTIEFETSKITKDYDFVLISDLHIGYKSSKHLENIIDSIIELSPHAVFITGDFIDSRDLNYESILAINKLEVPVYFVYGNHEYINNINESFFGNIEMNILDNTLIEFSEEIDIIGINDYVKDGRFMKSSNVSDILKNVNLNSNKYTILLKHEPKQIETIVFNEIDLILAGHTHNGQVYPFKYFVRMVYKDLYGLVQYGNTYLYITSGGGTWGPDLRFLTNNEIVLIKIKSH